MATTYSNTYPQQNGNWIHNPCATPYKNVKLEETYRRQKQEEIMRKRLAAQQRKQSALFFWTGFVFVLTVIFVILLILLFLQTRERFGSIPSLISSVKAYAYQQESYSETAYEPDHVIDPELEKEMDALRASGTPESLVELYERNPEARKFVLDYQTESDQLHSLDLSGEIVDGEIPLFLQWDERWGYETYGDDFLAVTGCGPTCLSMVACGLSGTDAYNPSAVAELADNGGYYVPGSGSSWSLMENLPYALGLDVRTVNFEESSIKQELEDGHPIICSMRAGDFTTGGHFIVLTGVDENGRIIVNDPNSINNSARTWEISELMPQIRNLWGYEKQGEY